MLLQKLNFEFSKILGAEPFEAAAKHHIPQPLQFESRRTGRYVATHFRLQRTSGDLPGVTGAQIPGNSGFGLVPM
jgi:hypothetical protein